MNINELREESVALRAEVLRRKAGHHGEKPFDPWQAVLDIGQEWQDIQPRGLRASYASMVKHMEDAYGEMAVLFTLLGMAEKQISAFRVDYYFDEGYASEDRGSRFEFQWKDVNLHARMLRLFGEKIVNRRCGGKPVEAIRDLLAKIMEHLEEYVGELKDIMEIGCERCLNNPPELHTEDLDGEWEKLNVRETMLPIVNQILSE